MYPVYVPAFVFYPTLHVQIRNRWAVYLHQSKAEREYVLPEGARRLRMEKPLGIVFEEVADDKGAVVVQVTILF